MLNVHKTLPSVSSLAYSMQDLVSLIENRKVFYCKALGNGISAFEAGKASCAFKRGGQRDFKGNGKTGSRG